MDTKTRNQHTKWREKGNPHSRFHSASASTLFPQYCIAEAGFPLYTPSLPSSSDDDRRMNSRDASPIPAVSLVRSVFQLSPLVAG